MAGNEWLIDVAQCRDRVCSDLREPGKNAKDYAQHRRKAFEFRKRARRNIMKEDARDRLNEGSIGAAASVIKTLSNVESMPREIRHQLDDAARILEYERYK